MLLSEIIQNGKHLPPLVFGVEADCECLSSPNQIQAIAFTYQAGKSGLSEQLMDAIITFNLAGAYVILEIPHNAEVDATYLTKLASNAGFSISLTPPEKEEDVAAWGEQCARFVQAFLSTPNFTKHIYPVQGYFTYLIAEKLGSVDALTPTDHYVLKRFTETTPEAWSDLAKVRMRKEFSDILDGEDGIGRFAMSIVSEIGVETERMMNGDHRASHND